MPWYRTGTVAITAGQNTVTGTGTAFSANARVGDAFLGPDGRWYEVTNIASGTVLSILPAYQGSTVTGGTYSITPVQGYDKLLRDAFNGVNQQYGATLVLFGGAADASTLRANIFAATRGQNADITALLGLTTALSVAQGGTGGNTAAAGRAGLGLGTAATANAVGTVSQSGGVSTGAIIERGSNASGRYTKFADGTMICSATLNFSQAVTFAQDGLFIGATPTFGFPAAFIAPPQFTFSARAQTVFTQPNAVTATTYQGLVMSMTSRTITADFVMTAQGRWYA
ncbi:phage tail protein [Pseudomonas sp. 2835]|uniref:phage tail protein n=1 Tax=Pseudomonas sp. 2835 TaxID=3156451 RepID=UPI003D1D4AE6